MVEKRLFGEAYGQDVWIYDITNDNGERVSVSTLGATIVDILVKDIDGNFTDVSLGYQTPKQYLEKSGYIGATIGRYANRICRGKFTLNNKKYNLYINSGSNHLHGGLSGFDKKIWQAQQEGDNAVKFTYYSMDMEENYPGNLKVAVTFSFNNENELKISYHAESDKDTPVNLTNHAYFNLNGNGNGNIEGHKLKIYADSFTPSDNQSVTTGEIEKVEGTPFDFREFKEIGKDINHQCDQLVWAGGYDHNFVINGEGFRKACEVYSEKSKILMQVFTDKPGVQFYTGNYLQGVIGKNDKPYLKRYGFCLETQFFPDSINKSNFLSTVLKPGEKYRFDTIYKFKVLR